MMYEKGQKHRYQCTSPLQNFTSALLIYVSSVNMHRVHCVKSE